MQKRKIIGITLVLLGIFLILGSFSSITGFVISEIIGKTVWSVIGIVFILGGIIFMKGGLLARIEDLTGVSRINSRERKELHRVYDFQGYRASQKKFKEYEAKYSSKERPKEDSDWVTLYHAYDITKRNRSKTSKRILKGKKALYLHDDPTYSISEIGPSETGILKVKIAKSIYDDLEIKRRPSHHHGIMYILPKRKIELAEYFHNSNLIKII